MTVASQLTTSLATNPKPQRTSPHKVPRLLVNFAAKSARKSSHQRNCGSSTTTETAFRIPALHRNGFSAYPVIPWSSQTTSTATDSTRSTSKKVNQWDLTATFAIEPLWANPAYTPTKPVRLTVRTIRVREVPKLGRQLVGNFVIFAAPNTLRKNRNTYARSLTSMLAKNRASIVQTAIRSFPPTATCKVTAALITTLPSRSLPDLQMSCPLWNRL